ncbi:polysaccharide pyruvyl transferase family protein [Flavobacteriaceae bacterium AU392]|nr:polysaccharide pyruvyl transferase family protein [Flavobacteriaceae bacterium]RKM82817.1 polysaccharide pyruvyl transferase family protein [Flavobacteriaceae bacterium AU392]
MIIRLYWWQEKRKDSLQNYGDLMSLYLTRKLSKKIVISKNHFLKKILNRLIKTYYICIGSVLFAANKNTVVWGGGIMRKDEKVNNATFLAVRGPRTRKRLLELNYTVPEVYGDPAILLPMFYENNTSKKYKIGIIPHFVDYEIVNNKFDHNNTIKVINLLTKDVEKTTDEILECENIISSSLHGVIVGQSYRIPSLWVKFSNKLSGDDIKFYDYFESMNIYLKKEIFVNPNSLSIKKIEDLLDENKTVLLQEEDVLELRKKDLLKSCPFVK